MNKNVGYIFMFILSRNTKMCEILEYAKPDKNRKIMQSLIEGIVNFIACISYGIIVQLISYQVQIMDLWLS